MWNKIAQLIMFCYFLVIMLPLGVIAETFEFLYRKSDNFGEFLSQKIK